MRRPSLEEAFLALAGHPDPAAAQPQATGAGPPAGAGMPVGAASAGQGARTEEP